MKKYYLFILLFSSALVFAQTDCKITYISNQGFMIETSGKKILTDALFGGFKGTWCDIPDEETKAKLENAEPPFDKIDIITVSHRHSDHFNASMVIKHLINDTDCRLVCPEQVDSVLSLQQGYNEIKDKIVAVSPEFYKDSVLNINGVEIRILRLEHSHYYETDEKTNEKINLHQNIENTGFVFNVGGIKLFHCGDSNPMDDKEFINYNLKEDKIDIAFLERLFMYHITAKGIEIIEKLIQPKNVILMHVEPGKSQKYLDVADLVREKIPDICIFEKPLDIKTFKIE